MNAPVSRHTLEAKYRRSRIWNIVLGAVVAFLGIVVVAQMLPGQSPTSTTTAGEAPGETNAEAGTTGGGDMMFVRRDADDPKAIGDIDAPVVLTEWVDLRCPFCASFSRDTLPTLIEEYVDTGKVRIEFTDVAYFGEESEFASVAAQAAADQDKYVEYLTAVFDAAPEKGHPALPREELIAFAEQVGMPDMDRFTAALDDPEIRKQAEAATLESQQLGVTAVPFFVAGETALSGAQPLATFREYLDESLAAAE